MTVTISPDMDRSAVADALGATVRRQDLRTSDSRRRRLETSSQRRTRAWDLDLSIDPDHPTAHCNQNQGSPEIVVSGREFPQSVTDIEPENWDYAAQRALGWHEDGHVLYTDHEDLMDRLNTLSTGDKGTAKQLWNALEDGAIELQLTRRWSNAYPVLRVLRANLFSENEPGIQDVERGGRVFPLAHATQALLLDGWMAEVYDFDRGIKAKLTDADDDEYHFARESDRELFVDEILPLIEDVIPDVLTTANAVDRNQRIFDFIEEVLPLIEDGKADGKSQMNRDEGQSPDGMPDDATDGHSGEAQEDADELEDVQSAGDLDDDVDPDEIDTIVVGGSGDSDGESIEDVELPDDVEVEIAEDVSDQRKQEAGVSGDLLDELEEIADSIKSAGGDGLRSSEIEIPTEDWSVDEATYQRAKSQSTVLARILRNRLQQERTSEVQRHQRRGRFTGRGGSARRAQLGDKAVKERVSEPEEKDYDFVFVLDRSSSMRGTMSQAEEALGMLALALEEVGVNVMIIELYLSEARLAKPFGTSIGKQKSRIFNGQCSGGTPLSPAVDLARERLMKEGQNTALVVVTDGEPNEPGLFEDAIKGCTMPTIGVNLTNDNEPTGMDDYDRAVAAEPGDDLQQTLTNLVKEVMF